MFFKPANVNISDEEANHFFSAIKSNEVKTVRTLIQQQPSYLTLKECGNTPLHALIVSTSSSFYKYRTGEGCNLSNMINVLLAPEIIGADIKNDCGQTALHIVMYRVESAPNQKVDIVKALLENGARVDVENKDGETVLALINKLGYYSAKQNDEAAQIVDLIEAQNMQNSMQKSAY